MKRYYWLQAGVLAMLLLMTACAKETSSIDVSAPLEVSLAINPQPLAVNTPATIAVTVNQQGKPVEDANEVKFEVWQKGQEEHEFIKAEKKGSGLYSIEKTFAQPGQYVVMYHVTARDYHSMNKQEFTVK